MPFYAHSKNSKGHRQDLVSHLVAVAETSKSFASKFGGGNLAYYAGLCHDVGKVPPEFQEYLQKNESDPGKRHKSVDHKGVGAKEVMKAQPLLAFIVKGHHGGLPSMVDLKNWIKGLDIPPTTLDQLKRLEKDLPQLLNPPILDPPLFAQSDPIVAEFFIRMLFSTLVDADFLDTEAHFFPDVASVRSNPFEFQDLWQRFSEDQAKLTGKAATLVNQVRQEVYEACLRASELPQGLYRLTVPTGGGKTRSSLAFALRHAMKHNLDRIIVSIPFTSIIEQTAQVSRSILGDESVLEHHSTINTKEDGDHEEISWWELAAENWDAPVIVTTTVQLFESLFSNMTSKCRKLHNIARSVIILDEVQSLPVTLLTPILDVIRQLVDYYGVTVVFCTATQPEYSVVSSLGKVDDLREIVTHPDHLFRILKRVEYHWPVSGETWTWSQVAEEMRRERQVLAVVNTKKDAIALMDALDDPGVIHLSTLLCGAHRREVLKRVKRQLSRGDPCQLVTTQVVEAGVDIDFPVVFRAVGPLDSIVQAAGRCNREGHLGAGKVVVFVPKEGGIPPGSYRSGADTARSLMKRSDFNIENPAIFSDYFRMLFQTQDTDVEKIQASRAALDYPKVASDFRMIKDETLPVVVRYRGSTGEDNKVDHLLQNFHTSGFRPGRWILRQLQPFMVNIRSHDLERYKKDGLVGEIAQDLFEWRGRYDPVKGLDAKALDPADLII